MGPHRIPAVRVTVRHARRRIVLSVGALAAMSSLLWVSSSLAQAQTASVTIVNFSFDPSPITIPVGGTVTWVNQDSVPHTATEDRNAWSSPVLNKGDSYSYTFSQPGSFTYYCVIHPNMHGTIVVGASVTATSQPSPTPQPTIVLTTPSGVSSPVPTSTPLPTPTAPPYPAAGDIYEGSIRALAATSGYRISETAVQTVDRKKEHFGLKGDVAPRSKAERFTLTVMKGAQRRTHILQVKTRAWMKRVAIDGAWKRMSVPRLNSMLAPMRNPLEAQSGLSVSKLETIGPDTFEGTPVWHIRWTETIRSLSGTVDALVSRQSSFPLHITRSLDNRAAGARVLDRLVLSHFGERVAIRPPKI